jgi:Tfp pilus assembly protein PilF
MRSLLLATVLVVVSAAPLAADPRDDAKEYVKGGIAVAQHRLWREAIARFKKAAQLDPTYAPAWNNLAIAYEQQGELGSARDAYEKALKLDPDNQYVKQNYELFREINDRANRQSGR